MKRCHFLFLIWFLSFSGHCFSIHEAKEKCLDLGFKIDTEQLGSCVLKLSKPESVQKSTPPEAVKEEKSVEQDNSTPIKYFKDCDECPEMVVIPAGNFLMGSPPDPEQDPFSNDKPVKVGEDNEKPQHLVNIKSFSLGKYEVTQEQWFVVMGSNPSVTKGRTLPAHRVSWDDAQLFVQKLSQKTGKKYRLPTEAEWEYAARGGSTTTYPWGNSDAELHAYAWFNFKSSGFNPVGLKKSNQFGLYDTIGSVWEWTLDCWHENYKGAPTDGSAWMGSNCSLRALRGGSLWSLPQKGRIASRSGDTATGRDYTNGFRVARTLP